ncbi:cobyrinic acid a,c-diamide synthase [Gordonia neofelifaecis NRRL B-59395]|uniref:Hydrogenobyrinate a,c-diamide synthase n=1 Tax=Gordonia neofelifaecis NRRL B-59395 TaxID=644548 RepID=F1YIE6_9ACTN|nr:cobyrinic acid a,c-diamide synthase [Gordonia neofelifaecis NRRL B-59395]
MIAAPASGSGKTTVTTGLIGALVAAGHRVAPFKVGPDYIDPGYHGVAAGRVGRNLDPNLVGADLIAPLYAAATADADIAVVEGVMGLFDGRITDDPDPLGVGSTAHVATLIGAPVVLVVDAGGHSQSLAAVLHGFLGYESRVRVAGVILNRVGSPRHEQVLRQACERVGLPVLGVVARDADLSVPSRHLGLIPAAERQHEAVESVAAIVGKVGAALDIPAIVRIANEARPPVVEPWSATTAVGVDRPAGRARPTIAVAQGAAFTFGYAEHAELLRAAGAEVVGFDPLRDRLPAGTDAVVIGGGFPEAHAEDLAANADLRSDLRAHVAAGRPVHAECAGLLYLLSTLDGVPMVGALDGTGTFGPRLTLGYRDAVALADSTMYRAGERVTGHEFHRSTVHLAGSASPAWAWRADGASAVDGVVHAGVHASYLHVHPAGRPRAVARFVSAAASTATDARTAQEEAVR